MSTNRTSSDVALTIRKGLRALARKRSVEFQLILSEFAIERLLFRLGQSKYNQGFVVKGATLFRLWNGDERRATWDLDLLGRGNSEIETVVKIVREICSLPDEDGIVFEQTSIQAEEIRHPDDYGGVRLRLHASLGEARTPLQIDIGFGDAVLPPPQVAIFPTLLNHAAPHVLAYPQEAVIAEKLEAMVSLGVTNSRMKDFYDLRTLAASGTFDLESLVAAVRATFDRRGTPLLQTDPLVLTTGFLSEPDRKVQWRAFLKRSRLEAPVDSDTMTADLQRFLLTILRSAASTSFKPMHWEAGGPWRL